MYKLDTQTNYKIEVVNSNKYRCHVDSTEGVR